MINTYSVARMLTAAMLLTALVLDAADTPANASGGVVPPPEKAQTAAGAQTTQPPAPAPAGDANTFAGKSNEASRYLLLGELAMGNDDAAAAADFFRRAMESSTETALKLEAAMLLHGSLLAAGTADRAKEFYEQLAGLPGAEAYSDVLDLMSGQRAFFSGDLKTAADIFRKHSIQLTPGDRNCRRALEMLAATLMLQGDSAGAQKACADLSAIAGNDQMLKLKALEGLIFCALEAGDKVHAQTAWKQLTAEIPQDLQKTLEWRLGKSKMLLDAALKGAGSIEKEFSERLKKTTPPEAFTARIAVKLADFHRNGKNYPKALEYNALAEKFAEKSFQRAALQDTVRSRLAAGDASAALQDITRYLERYPQAEDRWGMMLAAGNLNIQLKKSDAAIQYCEKVFNSADAPVQYKLQASRQLIWLYQQKNRSTDTVKMFDFAIKHSQPESDKDKLRQQAGEYLYQLGRYADAADYFAAAAKRSAESALWLAQSCYQLKSYSRAMQTLEESDFQGNKDLARKAAYLKALLTEHLGSTAEAVKSYMDFVRSYPDAPETADALFQAGVLSIALSSNSAPDIFMQYAQKFPGERAANALYKAFSELIAAEKESEAAKVLTVLEKEYAGSQFTIGAKFLMCSFLRGKKRNDEALKITEALEQQYAAQNPALMPGILYERALIYGQLQDHLHMQEVLAQLTSRFADNPIAAQGFFLMGELKMTLGDHAGALTAFTQARERSPHKLFTYSCTGRIGDASYALYNRTRQKQYLKQAAECCETLLKAGDLPRGLFYQSLYKLACCLRDGNDEAGALRYCRELLYQAQLARSSSEYYPAQWCAKALDMALKLLHSAIKAAPDAQQADALRGEAIRLLKVAGTLELPGEDIQKQLELFNGTAGKKSVK